MFILINNKDLQYCTFLMCYTISTSYNWKVYYQNFLSNDSVGC